MKVPISWLKEYVDVDATPQEIAEKLTFSGIEVEGIDVVGGCLDDVIVVEITAIQPHPGADRLRLCQVFDGKESLAVVCGADNYEVGDKAAFAPVGATLPGEFAIKKAKIRGEVSFGMLCAEDELGLSDNHDGILVLPRETATGVPLTEVVGPPETVLELEITWNRPDCQSIIGIARELAALYGAQLKMPPASYPEGNRSVDDLIAVRIDDSVGCPRYTARVLDQVVVGPSPVWMQRRLAWCGVRPINNVVDITNYVMLECGHPLHAFDYEQIAGRQVIVRRSLPGESLSTLDGVERRLGAETLVIADCEKAVAVGGIMGGAGSEISETTGRVLLESACFHPPAIRTASSALGLSTESSHRFERGVNAETVDWAGARAASLMVAFAGATAAFGVVDVYPRKPERREILLHYDRVRRLLGIEIGDDVIVGILDSLMLPVRSVEDGCVVAVPSFRPDLEIEADLIEEVARMHGLDNVPDTAPTARVVPDADDEPVRAVVECRRSLVSLGLTETVNYSFVSRALLDRFQFSSGPASRVVLPNPVSEDHAVMRDSLIPQMAETLGRNLSRQVNAAALFEIGTVFFKNEKGEEAESEHLCIGLMGAVGEVGYHGQGRIDAADVFLRLKGILEALVAAHHAGNMQLILSEEDGFEPNYGVSIMLNGQPVGRMGILNSRIRHVWRMLDPVAVAEIRLEPLIKHTFAICLLEPVPAYPSVNRDVALLVGTRVRHGDIVEVIRRAAPPELTAVTLFDIFRSEGMGDTSKSMAYSLTYRALDRTLTDEEVNVFHERIRKALGAQLDVEIR
jgi:phenylalanyl-tRNA synthetase beta chain